MSDSEDDLTPSRRSIVKGTAGALAVGGASTTGAAAESGESLARRRARLEAKRTIPEQYDDDEAKEAFLELAEPLLEALADEGLLDSPSLSAFAPIEDAPSTALDAEATTTASGKLAVEGDVHEGSGAQTAVIQAHTLGDTHEVAVHALPEVEFAYAIAVPVDDGERYYADNANPSFDRGPETASCTGDLCRKQCSGAPGAPFVIRSQGDTTCSNTCVDYSPSCSECDNQDKCSDSGW